MLFLQIPDVAFAQQGGSGTVWTAGVDFQSNSPCDEDAWAFDAVEMPNGDLVSVGYTTSNTDPNPANCAGFSNNNRKRVPACAVTDKYGTLKHSFYLDLTLGAGAFSRITNHWDGGCVLLGWQGNQALITKLDAGYNEVCTARFDMPAGSGGVDRVYTVAVQPDGKILLAGGFRNSTLGENFFLLCELVNNNGVCTVNVNQFTKLDNAFGRILDCKTATVSGVTYVLATGFRIRNEGAMYTIPANTPLNAENADGTSLAGESFLVEDFDVMVGIFPISEIGNGLDETDFKYYTSLPFDPPGYTDPNPINPQSPLYPQVIHQTYACGTQYGPLTPGKSDGPQFWGGTVNGSPVADNFFNHISKDVGRSIAYANGVVYVSAEMQTLEMTGSIYQGPHRNGQNGVILNELDCAAPEDQTSAYGAYKDGYIYIMRFDLATKNLLNFKNVAHVSGGDYYAPMLIDQTDGKLVIGSTTCDRGICGLPPFDECAYAETNFLAKYDPVTLEPVWQQHQIAYGVGNCTFGLIQTADGGYVMLGNNELEVGDAENETFNIIRFTPDCQTGQAFHQDGDYTITSAAGETWSPANKPNPLRIRGNVIIPSGKSLTITNGLVVEFAGTKNTPDHRKSGITVQQGGFLVVNGASVLKGLNCGGEQMWDGIVALGNPNQPAGPTQGRVTISGNARIENAVRGVVLGNTAWESRTEETGDGISIGTVVTATYMDDLGMGGGRLTAIAATFRNCGRGVVWNPQPAFSNKSLLLHTKFEFTGPLADPLYAFMGDVPAFGRPTAAELGCRLRSVRDVTFTNCSFINSASANLFSLYRNRPSGIYATDAKFSFAGGAFNPHFKDLYIGTESASLLSGAATTLSFSGAKMDNVYQGLNVRGNIAPFVSGCEYHNIPPQEDIKSGTPAGTFSVATQGITLSANQFDSDAGYISYGAIVNNSLGMGGAKVEFNTFTDFNIANQYEQDNSSLQTRCNTYQGAVGDVSWNVTGALANQIQVQDPAYFPDNKFLWDCGAPLLDIESTSAFSYYERIESPLNTNTILKCFTPTVTKILGNNAGPADCVIEDPCPNPPYCNSLLALYNNSGYALPYRNDLLNAYVRMYPDVVADSLYLPGTTRAISLLSSRNQQEDKRILTATYASLGNYTQAQQYLQQVTGATTETQDFIAYYTVIINAGLAGRDAYHLTAAEFAQLAPLMTHQSSVAENVKVLDHILNGVYHPLEAAAVTGGRPGSARAEASEEMPTKEGLRVQPNPFDSEVRFFAPEGTNIRHLRLVDISGKQIFQQAFGESQPVLVLNTAALPQGVLFYECRLSDGSRLYGKIVHQTKR
ncbi:MAG: T9SS type A sorting domain-containing protein [Saprospiraceae bacterium]|nr:T9SS type A sorting domain-containing protein [Saprospiraceae bacterium]